MDLEKALANVNSKETFIDFLAVLRDDFERQRWENGSIDKLLDAMQARAVAISATSGKPAVAEEPSWKAFAEILRAGVD